MDIKLDDMVYVATYGMKQKQITCPHCLGTKFCTVIMATGEQFTVGCGSCERGYEGSTGTITDYDYTPEVKRVRITRIEMKHGGNEYYSNDGYFYDQKKVFLEKSEAEVEAERLAIEHAEQQADKIKRKEKDTRSWSWNASYHKKCIERATRDIEYHTAKLNVANSRKKE